MKNCEFLYHEAKQKLVDLVNKEKIPLDKICLSFSGGRDSSIMLHMIQELGWKNKIKIFMIWLHLKSIRINPYAFLFTLHRQIKLLK